MYYYKIYGLTVKCTFEIPEAFSISEVSQPDVFVEMGRPAEKELEAARTGKICRLGERIAWFYLKEYGMFYVENGNHIIIWRETPKLTDLSRNSYLTGTTFGLLMFQRGILPIHSGAVALDGKCIVVVGDSGAGKSTNCVKLREKGCTFVTDDVSAVTIQEGKVMVDPSFPQQKLCRDAALRQGYELEELIYIDEDRDKYAVRLKDGYEKEALPMSLFIELVVTDGEQLQIEEVTGLDKLSVLYRNIYRREVWQEMGANPQSEAILMKMVEQIPIYRICRPNKGMYTDRIADWIIKKAAEL